MTISRRKLLGTSLIAGLGSSVSVAISASAIQSDLRMFVAEDSGLYPLLRQGDGLLVDIGNNDFTGDDLYLYPAWGQPRPYQVKMESGKGTNYLGFYHPATRQLLWKQTIADSLSDGLRDGLRDSHQFAGRVLSLLGKPELANINIPVLTVPLFPGTG